MNSSYIKLVLYKLIIPFKESKCIAIKIPEIKPEDINPDDYFDDLERRIDFILVWKKGKYFNLSVSNVGHK